MPVSSLQPLTATMCQGFNNSRRLEVEAMLDFQLCEVNLESTLISSVQDTCFQSGPKAS